MQDETNVPCNPWISMWLHPRRTMQQIIDRKPGKVPWGMAALYGFAFVLVSAMGTMDGDLDKALTMLIISPIAGPLGGVFAMAVQTFLLFHTGRWIHGLGTQATIAAAWTWSAIPLIWLTPVAIGAFLVALATKNLNHPVIALLSLGVGGVTIWSWFTASKCMAVAQGFQSAWLGLWNYILGGFVGIAFVVVLLSVSLFL